MSKSVIWNDDWLKQKDPNLNVYSEWARKSDGLKATCVWCNRDFLVRSGITNLKSHALSAKHREISESRAKVGCLDNFVTTKKMDAKKEICLVRSAEVRCVARTVLKGHSFESQEDIVEDLQAICPDSKVPEQMNLRRSKISYLLTDALFPYIRNLLLTDIKASDYYSIQIDEANKNQKFLGIVIRYLPPHQFDVQSVCTDLPVLDTTTSEEMTAAVLKSISECDLEKNRCIAVMTDSCHAMRGTKSGVVVRLQEELPNVIDFGGCTLHHIHNAVRYACDAADLCNRVELLVRNIYCHFKFSLVERDRLHRIASDFHEMKKLVFLRPVETRWLQILAVVERVLRLFQPLVQYFSESKLHGVNFLSIKQDLCDPKVNFFLCFLAEVLQPLQQFEKLFQEDGCHVHHLYPQMLDLMKRWLLRFVTPSRLHTKIWKVDVNDDSIWLSPFQIGMGEPARRLFADMTTAQQAECLLSVKAFFKTGTEKLLHYLPLKSKILRSCQMIDPDRQNDDNFVRWATHLARALPGVVHQTEIDSLTVEAKLHRQEISSSTSHSSLSDFWKNVDSVGNRPLLMRLVKAVLVIPHGNAEVERVFSNLNDIISKKRHSLASHTVKASVVTKSCLHTKNWTAATMPISKGLIDLCNSACAAYRLRLREEAAAAEAKNREQLESSLLAELEAEKKASKKMNDISQALLQKEEEIKVKIKAQQDADRMCAEAVKLREKNALQLEDLRRQQEEMVQKKQKEADRISQDLIKRKALELSITKELPKSLKEKRFRQN